MRMRNRSVQLLFAAAVWLFAASGVYAESAAELLEKGIYNEETTGNLDEAIKHYRQVVSAAKETEGLAAQAQFRLGRCLDKLGKKTEAADAFKLLVKNYPGQKELVAKAKKMLPGKPNLSAPPWKSGERLTLTMTLANGMPIGLIGTSVSAAKLDGKDVWEMDVRRFVTGGANSGVSHVVIDQKTSLPITTNWDHTLLGKASAKWSDDKLVITKAGKEGKSETSTVELSSTAYCNDQWMFGFRQLPMEIGAKTNVPVRVSFTGGNAIEIELTVAGKEKVTTPVGTFDCFKVETNIQQTFWITDTPQRYIAKLDAGGVTALLTSIEGGGDAKELQNDKMKFSCKKPDGWFHYPTKPNNDETSGAFQLVAPSDHTAVIVRVKTKGRLSSEERESPDAWADSLVQSMKDSYKGAAVMEGSRKAVQMAGSSGVTFAAEFEVSGRKVNALSSVCFKGKKAIEVAAFGTADTFKKYAADFEAIQKSATVE